MSSSTTTASTATPSIKPGTSTAELNTYGVYPKVRPPLTPEQSRMMEDWYEHYLNNVLGQKFGRIERFNHEYPLKSMVPGARTLEIGPGTGSHLAYEDLANHEEYIGLELRANLSNEIEKKYPKVKIVVGDCQVGLDFPDGHFHRVVAIHVLEHLTDLPKALAEFRRVLRPDGKLSVVIPCEGGLGYWLGRKVTTERMFEKRYNVPYKWMITWDHVSKAREILAECRKQYDVTDSTFYPLHVKLVDTNLVIGLTLSPKGKGK